MSRTRRRSSRAVIVLVIVAAAAAVAAWVVAPRLSASTSATEATQSSGTPGTPDATGTDQRSPAATTPAPFTIKPEPSLVATDTPVTRSGKQVDVSITYATYDQPSRTVQASGFVAGIIEDGGRCTLTLTKGSDVVTATSQGGGDATTTSCGLLQTTAGLGAGTWSAVLAYSSPDAAGRSRELEVTVR